MSSERYARQISFFGAEGQALIEQTKYAIVGLGGTGSHVVQQISFLGGRNFCLIDGDMVDGSNLNRLITAIPSDIGKTTKVDAAARLITSLHPEANLTRITKSFISEEGFQAIKEADIVFGCVDRDGARLILNEICQAYERPYIDIATGIDADNPREYGGRIHYSVNGESCIYCDNLLDLSEIDDDLASEQQRANKERIYGIKRTELENSGPSVVALNGIIASAAVMEFMVDLTGLRKAKRLLTYRGLWGSFGPTTDPPAAHCPYCKGNMIRGRGNEANIDRWIKEGFGFRV